jgi:hypothetical protein
VGINGVPAVLREQLGLEATGGLVQFVEGALREGRAEMVAACTERFERRVVEEVAGLRVQLAQSEATLRVELLKWCFLFWIGQVVAMTGIMSVMFRIFRP